MGNLNYNLRQIKKIENLPNIHINNLTLLVQIVELEKLLKSEYYSSKLDGLVSEVLYDILRSNDLLRKQSVVNLISLFKTLSPSFNPNFKTIDNEISDIKLRMNFNLATLIEIIEQSNNSRETISKRTPPKISNTFENHIEEQFSSIFEDMMGGFLKIFFITIIVIAGGAFLIWAAPFIVAIILFLIMGMFAK